ncbi:glycosyl transferase [Actinophytocola xinjiangensis]|uniref:Glycosyl transferase n=1 Tax=Actinophytocola xinjiangensis TaxID=485602 RepID=A0A7Z1B017_9PSEU|nr:glycosyltransferase family 39 protein [Actinophytocola xinjiangensis]OLF11414.1 glycosyl transferase [Actinophytocola xinjiangensis]
MTATLARTATPVAGSVPTHRRWPVWLLLTGTAALYLWNLSVSGWANSYYAAATQAASQSWQAWLFGSLDAGNAITVDKPPASLWLSGLFARLFGFSSWTVLLPQALAGIATVGLLYLTVKRVSGPVAALLAGTALALTPVATLMFRYNLPDAALTLLLVAAAYAVTRAVEHASWRWLALAGALVGLAFLTKMLQAFLVLPAFALAYLTAAPVSLARRLGHLATAAGATVVSAGWYVALVELWPSDSRPYISGSTTDSLWELTLGYNGLGRIFGGGGGGAGGAGGAGAGGGGGPLSNNLSFGGEAGLGRMFGPAFGTEISWLLPAALIALLAGLWFTRHAPRTDRTRASLLLWGGWLLVAALVFSLMTGIIHPYYSVALAPAVAALCGTGAVALWRGRTHRPAALTLSAMVVTTAVWTFILLTRFDDWLPWLRWTILAGGIAVATALAVGVTTRWVAVAATIVTLTGTGLFAVATTTEAHHGSIPFSGPNTGETIPTVDDETAALLRDTTTTWAAATVNGTEAADLSLASGRPVLAVGGWNGSDPSPTLEEFQRYVETGRISYYVDGMRSGEIATWVADNFPGTQVNNHTVYDLR